jgi:glc operon protein GlcG
MNKRFALIALVLSLLATGSVHAQSYGPNITLEQARTVLAAAEAEAVRQNFAVAIAVVDTAGQLVAYVKRDDTQTASVDVSQGKARTAAMFKRPTKSFQDTIAAGGVGLRALTLEGVVAAEGGVPLLVDGAIVGAIGVSGVTSEQDGMVAAAGAAALE